MNVPNSIPKVIHRIWLGEKPMNPVAQCYGDTWRKHHPEWGMQLWHDGNLPKNLVNQDLFDGTSTPGQRADLLRFELLYRFGGLYVDVDFECLRCLEPLINECQYFHADENPAKAGIGIVGSIPGHPLLALLIQRVREKWPWTPGKILGETGPFFYRRVLKEYIGSPSETTLFDPRTGRQAGKIIDCGKKPSLAVFDPWILYPYYLGDSWNPPKHPDAYAAHHWHKSWAE